jgi:Ca2+-binding RTX toxin-like protein
MQVNYWTNGVEHPFVIDLGFDASMAFHTYGFLWQADKIEWYLDGQLVHTEDGTNGALPTHPGKIITNLWGTSGAGVWSSDYDVSNGDAELEVTHIHYSTDLTSIGTANNDELYGLAMSDFLDGGMGADVLYGGLGNDTLKGGEGQDTFVFNTALDPAINIDTILDFSSAEDTIVIDVAIFEDLAGKTIVSDNIEIGTGVSTASETDNYFIYNTTSGALYYDADGSSIGGVDAVQIAQLGVDIHPTLVASDFAIL